MKYLTEKYRSQLDDLAGLLAKPLGDIALGDTIEFEPVVNDKETDREPEQ